MPTADEREGGLRPPSCCKAGVLTPADHQVVQHPDVEKAQSLLQALGDLAVGFARFRVAAWVIVEKDDGSGVQFQCALGDHPRVHLAAVDGAAKEMFGCEDVVLGVEENDAEDFVRQVGAADDKVAASLLRAVDPALAPKALFQDVGCGEQDAFFVHLNLVLSLDVSGALHRFFSTSALCASWEPTGEASSPTAPGSEHRASGAQRRAATKRQRREGG